MKFWLATSTLQNNIVLYVSSSAFLQCEFINAVDGDWLTSRYAVRCYFWGILLHKF